MGSLPAAANLTVKDQHIGAPQPVKVIVIGAGISGIAFSYKAQFLEGVEYVIYEKNADVGGTWLESRYPGCSCDIPAHSYSYPWVGNPEWSKVYAGAEEIWNFYQQRAKEYGLYKHAKFNQRVIGAEWDEDSGRWTVKVQDAASGKITVDSAEVVLNCAGVLNQWKWPDIQGLQSFGGTLVHTGNYPHGLDLAGKRVAVIGAGSSAIQVVPTIQPIVKSLVTFARSPTWVAPQFVGRLATNGRSTKYTEAQKERFRTDPEHLVAYRREIDQELNSRFPNFYKNSPAQKMSREIVEKSMRKQLAKMDPALREQLIPDFDVGCRRVTPGEGYLEALQEDNVEVVRTSIQEITPDGVVTREGKVYSVDVIIAATGYDTSYVPGFHLTGRNGVDLAKRWKQTGAEAYFTCAVPDMPNYFMVVGPNTPISNGSLMPSIEAQVDFALSFVDQIQRQGVKSAVVSQSATTEFNDHKDAVMELLTFSGNCNSWYKGGTSTGRIVGPWPGSVNHFLESIKNPRLQDFEYTYRTQNRFMYLGKGLSARDLARDNLGWYIRG
ncbi:flavin-containing monooxygenase [Aspergillus candidus]|uniref:Flavin-binding monooxygenase n=1 Tax=Aspergillus candidus TaxID=41067 RepID=A0A2I2F631_ASPCN|nr:flavin-binding monooxygenase [Aspergillus candidus]PLB36081.1 flavin-binding monooxygenase [Aspergillus candidus]